MSKVTKTDLLKEPIEFMAGLGVAQGLPDLLSKIFAVIYFEPKEIALEEIAKKTGYGLSSISSAMKMVEPMPHVKRIRKPGSKKVYFYMDKNMTKMMMDSFKQKLTLVIKPGKEKLPLIIKNYEEYLKTHKDKEIKAKLKILKDYHNQITEFEQIIKKFLSVM
jgi:DNA-binding transcriptional regulator GbsR (MarR family)